MAVVAVRKAGPQNNCADNKYSFIWIINRVLKSTQEALNCRARRSKTKGLTMALGTFGRSSNKTQSTRLLAPDGTLNAGRAFPRAAVPIKSS